jgi:Cof subfamily protein (haloacid dehalogenase superfamily)
VTGAGVGEPAGPARESASPYRLVATDLDGTLLRDDGTISHRTRKALAAVAERGIAHIVVTGRSAQWTKQVLAELDYSGLAVCGQGAQLYDAGARRLLTSMTLDRRLARLALARIEAETGPLALAAPRDGVDGEVLVSPDYRLRRGLASVPFTDRDELWAQPLNKMYMQHPRLDDEALAKAARAVAGDLVTVTVAGEGIVELLPTGLSKARGLSLAARRLGVSAGETIAFGDMPNDIPMFDWAACGVAVSNAHMELLAVADEVTASNEEDGVALVLERLVGERG